MTNHPNDTPAKALARKALKPIVLGAVAVFALIGFASCGGDNTTTPTQTVTAPATPSQPTAKLGTAVKAGDMSYTVTDFTTTKKLSSVFGNKIGNWVVVSIKVDNQGKDAAYITSGDFKIIESDGTEYSTDTDAFMYLKTEENLLLEKLNPKLSQTGKLLFAVPEGITGKGMTFQATNGFINKAEVLLEK